LKVLEKTVLRKIGGGDKKGLEVIAQRGILLFSNSHEILRR